MSTYSRPDIRVLAAALALSAACSTPPTPAAEAPSPAKPPEGRHAVNEAVKAFRDTKQFTIIHTETASVGTFKTTIHVDCETPYFYFKRESGTSLTERVFVQPQSFSRVNGTWALSRDSYDPRINCQSFAKGTLTELPFGKMMTPAKIEYLGQDVVGGYACHDYTVTYLDQVLNDTMTESADGKSAVREETTKPVEGTLCIAVDDWLPLRAVIPARTGVPASTIELLYEPFARITVRLPNEG